jgi:signal transduction histidine kinase
MFKADDLEMLKAFASQAAAAIQNARLYTETDRSLADRVQELEDLAHAAREMNRKEEMEDVFEIARQWALKGTQAVEAWVAMCEPEKDVLIEVAGPQVGREIGKDDPLVKTILEANTPHFFLPDGDTPARIAIPILIEDVCVAVMVLEAPQPFPTEALQFTSRLGNQAAIAVDKAALYERIEAQKGEQAQFVSVVSHELRLPMTSIQGYTDLLKQGAIGTVNEQQLEFLTVIRNNVGRMSALISDLSDIYKMQGGRLLLEPEMTSMRSVVERMVRNRLPSLAARKQQVTNHIAPELPRAYVDVSRVEQVLEQILRNASLYSPIGSQIEVRGVVDGEMVRIIIKDEGIGIGEEEKEHIFTQFFRSERQDVRDHHGWGLGLSLTQSLVGLMGGEIGYESKQDQGSTFWFTLPTKEYTVVV